MKPFSSLIFTTILGLLGALMLTSCGDIQQELFLNPDGSGKLEASFDLGEMMSMMKGFNGMGMSDDTVTDDNLPEDTSTISEIVPPKDPMQTLMDRVTDPEYPLPFDTLMSIADIMPDSVRQKENRMDLLKKISIHMVSPANSSDLKIGIVISYDNRQQLSDVINHLDTLDGTSSLLPGGGATGFNKSSFTMYDVNFMEGWIKFDSVDYSGFNTELGMSSDSTMGSEDMGMMEMMFGSSKIRSIVHVPGEVVSCSQKDALITKDDRVIIENDFLDVMKKGKLPGYTIHFKPRK